MLLAHMGYDLMFRHLVDQIGARLARSRAVSRNLPTWEF